MKIAIYNTKGWAGKTPIATSIALEKGYAVWTNEPYHVYDALIPQNKLLSIGLNEAFPDLPSDIEIVFDLAGSISKEAVSITSAIKQADVVIVPIYNELKCITAGLNTISEVRNFNQNIIVVATKLKRQGSKDSFSNWRDSADYQNIAQAVLNQFDKMPVSPLKYSNAFDAIFEQEQSINQLIEQSGLNRYHYSEVQEQLDALYSLIYSYAK